MTMTSELIWGFSFFAGALAQLIARLSGWPSVVLLLASGLVLNWLIRQGHRPQLGLHRGSSIFAL